MAQEWIRGLFLFAFFITLFFDYQYIKSRQKFIFSSISKVDFNNLNESQLKRLLKIKTSMNNIIIAYTAIKIFSTILFWILLTRIEINELNSKIVAGLIMHYFPISIYLYAKLSALGDDWGITIFGSNK